MQIVGLTATKLHTNSSLLYHNQLFIKMISATVKYESDMLKWCANALYFCSPRGETKELLKTAISSLPLQTNVSWTFGHFIC